MEEKHQTSYDYRYNKKCYDFDDEEYWNKILERRNDPIPASVQAKIDQYNQESRLKRSEPDDDFDVTKAYTALRAQAEKAAEEEYSKISWEEMIEESRKSYSSIPMYDFGLGQKSNEQAITDFYGSDMVRRIRKEIEESYDMPNHVRKTGQISQKLWQELRDIRAGKKPRAKSLKKEQAPQQCFSREQNNSEVVSKPIPEPNSKKIEVTQRERQPGDDYFMTIERGIIRNKSYRELFKGPSIVYEWIWANVVRGQWIDTNGYPIKEKYYDNGLLAFCSSYRQIAKDCGLHKNKVKEYIDNFKDAGVIKVEHLVPQGKKRGQSVFIIGTWHLGKDENGKEKVFENYFVDDVFLTKKGRSECAQLKLVKY